MSWVTNKEFEKLYAVAAAQGANKVILSSQSMCEKFIEIKRQLNGRYSCYSFIFDNVVFKNVSTNCELLLRDHTNSLRIDIG
jgi:hypothetical protein